MATILCVDADAGARHAIVETLRIAGHAPLPAADVAEALRLLDRGDAELVVAGEVPGPALSAAMRAAGHDVPVVALTADAGVEPVVAAVRAGAADCLAIPLRPGQLEAAVADALDGARERRDRALFGDSPAIRRVLRTTVTAARTWATVLLHGESGTGKGLFARLVHDRSDRRDGPFVEVACATWVEELGARELLARLDDALARARGGTLLLDEIAELPPVLQARLLHELEARERDFALGPSPVRVDVRVVATTSRDLLAESRAGRFREDLYYRLATIPIALPPLRDRREDIPTLAHGFAVRAAREFARPYERLAPDALVLLQAHAWPGNVRELQRAVARAVILSDAPVLTAEAFDRARFGLAGAGASAGVSAPGRTHASAPAAMLGAEDPSAIVLRSLNVDAAEQALIARALEVTGQNKTRAAELLGMSVRTLRAKLNGGGVRGVA